MSVNHKQKVFVEQYLQFWNATDAYLAAYPKSSRDAARRNGSRLLTNDDIARDIKLRLAEKTMSADEVLVRLRDEAAGTLADFMDIAGGEDDQSKLPTWNFQKAAKAGKLGLIRKIRTKTVTTRRALGDEVIETVEQEVALELYSAQTAKELIGKHHKLFTEKIEHEIHGDMTFTGDDAAQARAELETWKQQTFSEPKSNG